MFIVYQSRERQFIVASEHEKEFIEDLACAGAGEDVTSEDWDREEVKAPYIEVDVRRPKLSW